MHSRLMTCKQLIARSDPVGLVNFAVLAPEEQMDVGGRDQPTDRVRVL